MQTKEYRKKYYLKNIKRIKIRDRLYRKKNKNKVYLRNKNYRIKNLEKCKLYQRNYYKINKNKIKKYHKKWRVNNHNYLLRHQTKQKFNKKRRIYHEKIRKKKLFLKIAIFKGKSKNINNLYRRNKLWRDINKKYIYNNYSEKKKRWYKENKNIISIRIKKRMERNKLIVLNYYGKKCICCGQDNIHALTIEHTKLNGARHREKIGGGGAIFYRWLIKNKFPKHYTVMCWTCNILSYRNKGKCYCKEKGYKYADRIKSNEYVHKILLSMPSLLQDDKKI